VNGLYLRLLERLEHYLKCPVPLVNSNIGSDIRRYFAAKILGSGSRLAACASGDPPAFAPKNAKNHKSPTIFLRQTSATVQDQLGDDPLAPAEMQHESQIEAQRRGTYQ